MRSELDKLELIDSYLNGNLSAGELEEFHHMMETSPDFRSDVASQKFANGVIEDQGYVDLKAKMEAYRPKKKPISQLHRPLMLGAGLALISGFVFWFSSNQSFENNDGGLTPDSKYSNKTSASIDDCQEGEFSDYYERNNYNSNTSEGIDDNFSLENTTKEDFSKPVPKETHVSAYNYLSEDELNSISPSSKQPRNNSLIESGANNSNSTEIAAEVKGRDFYTKANAVENLIYQLEARPASSFVNCGEGTIRYNVSISPYYQHGTMDIVIQNVSKGVEPYQFSLDEGEFGSQNVFSNLKMKKHIVTVKDSTGCEVKHIVDLDDL